MVAVDFPLVAFPEGTSTDLPCLEELDDPNIPVKDELEVETVDGRFGEDKE